MSNCCLETWKSVQVRRFLNGLPRGVTVGSDNYSFRLQQLRSSIFEGSDGPRPRLFSHGTLDSFLRDVRAPAIMLPGDDLGWRPPSDLCKADTKVDVSFGGRELLSGVREAGPCVTWCARFRCGSPLDRTGGRRRGSVRWGSGLAEKLIRTIAEKCYARACGSKSRTVRRVSGRRTLIRGNA